jgi:hypothetical protein
MLDVNSDAIPARPYCSCDIPPNLLALEHSDPIADSMAAAQMGDYRFMSVGTFNIGSYPPGISDLEMIKERGTVHIEGTHDVFVCYEYARLMVVAANYAAAYNHSIKSELGY